MKYFLNILSLVFTLLIISCSTTEVTKTDEPKKVVPIEKKFVNDVELNLDKTISWVNLMPGSTPKFHISGKFVLLKSDKYNLETTKLSFIKIYQNNKELYNIKPKVIESIFTEAKEITYSTIQGLSVNNMQKNKNKITFELIFKDGSEELKFWIDNITIEEVF